MADKIDPDLLAYKRGSVAAEWSAGRTQDCLDAKGLGNIHVGKYARLHSGENGTVVYAAPENADVDVIDRVKTNADGSPQFDLVGKNSDHKLNDEIPEGTNREQRQILKDCASQGALYVRSPFSNPR